MLFVDLHNTTKATRIIYDGIPGSQKELRLPPGHTMRGVHISAAVAERLRGSTDDIEVSDHVDEIEVVACPEMAKPVNGAVAALKLPPLMVWGMMGVGDNVMQRALLRELMKKHDVTLDTPYESMYHDLVAAGLKLSINTRVYTPGLDPSRRGAHTRLQRSRDGTHIGYMPPRIKQCGSILAAMFASVGLEMPERPDFSLPVPQAWRDKAMKLVGPHTKPLMVYRPIVLNRVWSCPGRSPDQQAYGELYRSIRDRFHVVSICNMATGKEWIVDEQPADVKLHNGELDFQAMAGLFAEAALAFGNAGFFPVMAQAVGTPSITVYGGHESSKTTQRVGAHLAPSLFIEPDIPCDCHDSWRHQCDRRITLGPAVERIKAFAAEHEKRPPRVLVFGTCYVDSPHRANMLSHWVKLHTRLNPQCDLMLVDSASPCLPDIPAPVKVWSFPDNVGHLSRNKGRDGWGRAFCQGLQFAVDGGYDYAVHIEGDSLLRLPVMPLVREMEREGTKVASTVVAGMRYDMREWVETGLMIFRTDYVRDSGFIAKYDWPNRQASPTPENVIWRMLGGDLKLMPWKTQRGDKKQITAATVGQYDWITHCWDHDEVYEAFMKEVMPLDTGTIPARPQFETRPQPSTGTAGAASGPPVKMNFGCGANRLPGWQNHDADVDITKPLPFADASADFVLAEHVLEHVDFYQAVAFLRECHRILRPGGVARIAVPSVEQIMEQATPEYCAFTAKFPHPPGPVTVRTAIHNILFNHGHKAPWTAGLLRVATYFVGFDACRIHHPGESNRKELQNIEGHQKIIGEQWNRIETIVVEAEVAL